jgi:hypothetical protein
MPIIVWEHSSLADWVKQENIGIVVSTLKHIDSLIDSIPDEKYHDMVQNARRIGQQLREGYYLKQALR